MKETQRKVKERERRDLVDQDSRRPNGRGRRRALPGRAKAVTLMTNLNTDPSAPVRRDRQLPSRPVSKAVSLPRAWLSYLGAATEDTASWLYPEPETSQGSLRPS